VVLPSEASGGKKDAPELTSNVKKANKDISKKETREKRQYFPENMHLNMARFVPFRQRFYPIRQPIHYTRKAYAPFYGAREDPDKPRISVHIEAEKKNYITHIDDEARDKRQLFGMTSLMSPARPIQSPLSSHGSKKEDAKSEVPKHRSSRGVITEVPIRAEQHHGVVKTNLNLINEAEETKKSTIQRLQKRHIVESKRNNENDDEHAPIRKRQFVFNSEPPVVRAIVNGNKQQNSDHSPIGNLIKMIAGHSAKNILGLNSKSFDVFPGPLPDTKDNSVWNIKSVEAGNTEGGQATQAYTQQGGGVAYQQAGLESVEDSQRRADALKSAEQQAEAEKAAYINEQNAAVEAQTAARIQQQKLEEERAVEREKQIENEQELEQARAGQMARLVTQRANERLLDMSDELTPVGTPLRPVGAMIMPMQQQQQQEMVNADADADASDDDEDAPVYRNHVVPTMLPTMMPIQPDFFRPTQVQFPMEAMAFQQAQRLQPMATMEFQPAQRLPPMSMMAPTPTAFIPTPSMMFMRTPEMMPFTEQPPTPFFQELESVHRSEYAHASDEAPYLQPYPIQKHHHRKHLTVPTESPFHFSNFPEPEMSDDDQKPEVHVHIQTEKSKIPQNQRVRKDDISKHS